MTRTDQAICFRSAQFQASPCGICGVQTSIAKGFSAPTSVSPLSVSFHQFSILIHSFICHSRYIILAMMASCNKTFQRVADTSNLGLSEDKFSVYIYCVLFNDAVNSYGYKKSNDIFSE